MRTPSWQNTRAVVVTGVSSGIGEATLRELVRAGFQVFGSVRKQADADRLSRELGDAYVPLVFDVTDAAAVARGADEVRRALGDGKLSALINNAGIAVPGPLMELPLSEFRRQIEVNLVGVLAVTQAFFPLLRKAADGGGKPARIVTISSVAGKFAMPFLGPYAASKHGLEGFSASLRRECMVYGIDVVIIGPATIATPIWKTAEDIDVSRYAQTPWQEPMRRMKEAAVGSNDSGTPPQRIGQLIVHILGARKPRARYTIGKGKTRFWIATHLFSARAIDRIIARRLGLHRKRPHG